MNNQAAQTMPEPEDWQKIHVLMAVMEFRPLTDVERKEMHEALVSIREAALAQTAGVDVMTHFCNAIDNLNDMPVSDEWARKWTAKAEFLIGMGPDPGAVSMSDTCDQLLAAAPAASGGEADPSTCIHKFGHDGRVCLRCGWNFRENGDPPQPPSAASVSERARELRERAEAHGGGVFVSVGDIRAIKQALTQQRGAPVFDRAWVVRDAELRAAAYNLLNLVEGVGCERWQNANGFRLKDTQQWVEFYIATKNVQSFGEVTTPQPSADAVRELVQRWRELSVKSHRNGQYQGYDTLRLCADELESLLSAASGEKGVG